MPPKAKSAVATDNAWTPGRSKNPDVWRQQNPKGMQSFLASMIQTCSVTEVAKDHFFLKLLIKVASQPPQALHPCKKTSFLNGLKLSVDLNEPKDSSKTDKAAQNGRTPKSMTLEIHHGGWFTLTPSRSYIGGQVSLVYVVDIDEFCLHDLKDMVVKLGYGVKDLMYCHFLIPTLGLDYGLHSLNVDADVLEMSKYVKDYKIILVYVEHGSNVNKTLTPMCHKNLTKEWEQVSSKSLSIGEVTNNLSKKQPSSFVEAPIVVEYAEDPFEELDDLLGEYAHIGKQITGNEITGNEITRNESTRNEITRKQMVVHVGNSSTVDDVLELGMLFETEWVGLVEKFKEVEVDADNESEEESDTKGDYTMDSDSEDLDYDPKHDDVFDDDEHIVEEVHVNMNNFRFTEDPKHDISIGGVDVQDDDLDVIDYDSFGSDLDDGIDSERRMQLKELRRIGKQKNKGPNKYYFYLGQQFACKEIVKGRVKKHSIETRRQLILVKNDNERVRVRCQGTIPTLVPYVAINNNTDKNVFSQTNGGPVIRENNNNGKQNILGKDKTVEGKDHVIKSLATNPDILVRAVQDQMQKQFEVGVSKMKAFRAKRITFDIMTGPWLGQILRAVGVDANNVIYPLAYAIVEAESKASWCWFLNLLGEDLAIASVFSSAEHRYCVRHIHKNMKSQFKGGVYKEMLWNAAKATSEGEFKKKMVVESRTVIIPPLYKPPIGRPPKKRKKSNDEIASQSASSGKLSRKGKSVSYGKCGNVGHNRKGCRGQGGGSSQAVGATNVSGQATGARKVSGQAADARKTSSQPSAAQSTTKKD
ncbi:mutator type transposase [Tanacetum coccineum]